MSYQVGVIQTGLASEQQPYIRQDMTNPLGVAGLSMPGSYIDGISSAHYVITGRTMQYGSWFYKCMVKLSLVKKMNYPACASVYAPNMIIRIISSGTIIYYGYKNITTIGVISKISNIIAAARGFFALRKTQKHLAKGLLQSQHDIVYRVQGMLGAYQHISKLIVGTIQAVHLNKIVIWGRASGNYVSTLKSVAVIGSGISNVYKTIGILQKSLNAIYQLVGQMKTDIETRLLLFTGKISVPQFIASVPRRMQDFVTNKKWWR